MSLRFIIGRAGTGKTYRCINEIRDELTKDKEKTLIFLVPEQATFQMEKELLKISGKVGTFRAQVLSFQRLAWRILQETGGGIYPALNELGKNLILTRLLEEHQKDIKVFNRVKDKAGFVENLSQLLSELKVYEISPEEFEASLQKIRNTDMEQLKAKMEDINLLYKAFEEYIDKQYIEIEDNLSLMSEKIHIAQVVHDAEIWIDGFHGFTPQEYEVIKQLLSKVFRVNITLCIDDSLLKTKLEETDIFYPTWETYQKMLTLAHEIQCPVEERIILNFEGKHRFVSPELLFLEGSFGDEKNEYIGDIKGIKICAAKNRRGEIGYVARSIINLCRDEEFHYKDIAVLTRDFSHYEHLLPVVFKSYEIPYFLDKKREIIYHPLLDLLKGALEIVEKGWTYDNVFRYLKTDLASLSRQEIDSLENYCLAHGIRGKRWTDGEPWLYRRKMTLRDDEFSYEMSDEEEKALKRINRARAKAVKPLRELEQAFKKSGNASEFAAALYKLLEELAIARKLQYWSKKAEENGLLEEAQMHSQVWQKVIEVFDQVVEVLGQQEISIKEFNSVFINGLDNLELGLIPPGLDQVLIGSLDRSRNPELKAVFIIGVNDGVFPARIMDEGIFTDEEREYLEKLDLQLAPTCEKRLYSEEFLIYMALTRASHHLWICYPLADDEGKALSLSSLVTRIIRVFGLERAVEIYEDIPLEPNGKDDIAFIVHAKPAIGYLASIARQALAGKETNPLWWNVYNWFIEQKEWQEPLNRVISGLFYENKEENLHAEIANKLYGSILKTSVSRMEKFRACPFSHFLQYGLKLQERQELSLQAPDLGQFFHAAIEEFYMENKNKEMAWSELSLDSINQQVEVIVDRIVPKLQNEILLSTARYRYITKKLKRTVFRAIKTLREHESRGIFQPLGIEVSFGLKGQLPGLKFDLKDGTKILIEGRIDRVDGVCDENGYYVRIIDYKSGYSSLSLLEIYYGLKLQLLTYLDVIMKNAHNLINSKNEVLPGGVFYFQIGNPFIAADGPMDKEEIEEKILKELKMKGYLLRDASVIRMMDKDICGYSNLLPVALNKEEEVYKNSESAITIDDFAKLRKHVEKVICDIGTQIMQGSIDIKPYRYKNMSPCRYCSFTNICSFDAGQAGQSYRIMTERDKNEVWAVLNEGGDDELC